MLGQRVATLGAGRLARPDDPDAVIQGLLALLRDESITESARRFQKKYAEHDNDRVVEQIVAKVEALTRG